MECYEELAEIFRVLAGERVCEALLLLHKLEEATPTELAREMGVSGSRASQIIANLRGAGLVKRKRRSGTKVVYSLTGYGRKIAEVGESLCRQLRTI